MPLFNQLILIVEDDLDFQNLLIDTLNWIGFTNLKTVTNYDAAINSFIKEDPAMLLIDIDLRSSKSGIDIAHTLNSYYKIPFAFITSNYSDETYERAKATGPVAFINKEISALNLKQVVELGLRQNIRSNKPIDQTVSLEDLFIKIGNVLKKVSLEEVDWFGIDGKYAYVKIAQKQFPLSIYLKELEDLIPKKLFIRTHQSFIINAKKIESINTIKNTIFIKNKELPIGRSYKKNLFNRIKYL